MNKNINKEVKYAVIPCAGRGTRFLPITKGVAKEMCPIVDKPALDYIVDECIDSGITNIILIVSKDKIDIVKRYYSMDNEFEEELIEANKIKEKDLIHNIATKCKLYFVIQEEMNGLGAAVYLSKDIVKDNSFVVCCGDDICTYEKDNPPIKQLVEAYKNIKEASCIVGGKKVEHQEITKYASMDISKTIDERAFKLKGIIEKPSLEEAPSDYASLGKWVFSPKIYDYLEKTPKGKGNEIQLTDAIALMMKENDVYYYDFIGTRYDCGDKLGYLKANIDVGLSRDDLKEGLLAFLKEKVESK